MKKIKESIWYQLHSYAKSNKYIIPLAVLAIFLYFNYSILPVGVLEAFGISMIVMFLLMVWVGAAYQEVESPVSEQLIILRMGSEKNYYRSNVLVLIILEATASVIAILFPILQNLLNHFHVFDRAFTLADAGSGLFLHFCAALAGGGVGLLFHPRVVLSRKFAVLCALLTAILGVVRGGIETEIPVLRFITWVLPPIAGCVEKFAGTIYYSGKAVFTSGGMLLVYGCVIIFIRNRFLIKNKF